MPIFVLFEAFTIAQKIWEQLICGTKISCFECISRVIWFQIQTKASINE